MTAEVIERDAHLADVDDIEGEVVEMRCGWVGLNQCHNVVVRVDVEPDSVLTEPVCELHTEGLGVEAALLVEVAGQEIDVPELAWAADDAASGRAGVRDQPRFRLAVGQQPNGIAVRVGRLDPAFSVITHGGAELLEVCARLSERAVP